MTFVRLLTAPLAALSAALALATPAFGQYVGPSPYQPQYPPQYALATPIFSEQELESMLAPIALYPDAVLSQILMASTYPLEVRAAAQWLRANPGLAGEQAVQLAAPAGWDPSVQSLSAFPQIVAMMDENFEWTARLGEAFLAQQPGVMDAVQSLRQRAWAAGTLRSDGPVLVNVVGPSIVIEPAQPPFVYVPYYDPLVVYGRWVLPVAPMRWRPWPGYAARPGAAFHWGPAVALPPGVLFGRPDWGRRHVVVVRESAPHAWIYAPEHRRGEPYRHEVLRRQFPPAAAVARPPATERAREERREEHSVRPAQPVPQAQGPWDRAQHQQGPWDKAQPPQQPQRVTPVEPRRGEPRPSRRDERSQMQPVQPASQAHFHAQESRREPSASAGSGRAVPTRPAEAPRPPINTRESRHVASPPAASGGVAHIGSVEAPRPSIHAEQSRREPSASADSARRAETHREGTHERGGRGR